MWVSDCLQGKYKGLEKAARIYTASLEQPMYFRLVILELMENLTSGDQVVRKNSLWMLTQVVDEQRDYMFMSPTIQILISSLGEKNQAIRYYSLKIINQIASTYYDQFKGALPQIVNNLKDSSSKIKMVTAAIITQFIEADSNAMESAIGLLVQALKDKELEIREMAIKALLRVDQHVDKVVQAILELFQDEDFRSRMIRHILEFIKRKPESVVDALRITIKNKDENIRENSIIFMHQISESKHIYELSRAVPELLNALNDKNKLVHRTATRILYLISKQNPQSLYRGKKQFIQLLKIKNKQLITYFIYILVQLIKHFPDDLSDQVEPLIKILENSREWEDVEPETEIINIISLCTLARLNNEFAYALNLAQDCVRKFGLDRNIYELYLFIGHTHYYLGNYSDSIQAYLKAETAHKRDDYYTATIASIMIAFNFALLRTFNSCLDYMKDAEKYYEIAEDRISLRKFQELQTLMDFIKALCNHDFESAESTLKFYQNFVPARHPLERKFQLIDLKNVRKVKKFYLETREFLEDLKKDEFGEEPETLNE